LIGEIKNIFCKTCRIVNDDPNIYRGEGMSYFKDMYKIKYSNLF